MGALLAMGCTVCGAGQEGTSWAYLAMTGVVSLSPLVMIGGIAWWLKRASDARAAQGEVRDAQAGVGARAESPAHGPHTEPR